MEQASVHEANARRVPRPHRYGAAAGCERRRRAGGGQGTGGLNGVRRYAGEHRSRYVREFTGHARIVNLRQDRNG